MTKLEKLTEKILEYLKVTINYRDYRYYTSSDDLLQRCEKLIRHNLENATKHRKEWFDKWLEENYTTYLNGVSE